VEYQPSGCKKIRVSVLDSSPIYTKLLADALRRDEGFDVFNACPSDIIRTVAEKHIDVLLVARDIEEKNSRGLEIVQELQTKHLETRAIVLLDSPKPEAVVKAFWAGARGLFSRSESLEKLAKCIRCVYSGQVWATNQEILLVLEAFAASPTLTACNAKGLNLLSKRETQIVHCLAEGLTNKEIAEQLKLSQHTVKNYLFRIFEKLGVSTRVALLFITLSQGITTAGHPSAQHLSTTHIPSVVGDRAELQHREQGAELGAWRS
jgi:DNA-binding NarL/FixJ family response regulator